MIRAKSDLREMMANRAYKALLDLLVRKVSKALMEMTDSLVRGVYEERLAKEE